VSYPLFLRQNEELNEKNFLLYAAKAYDRPNAILSELDEDLKRLKYTKRLLNRYKATGNLKLRLILNHIIILYNVFGPEAATRLLFYKIDRKDYDLLKTFLVFLNYLPSIVYNIKGINIRTKDIPIHPELEKILNEEIGKPNTPNP